LNSESRPLPPGQLHIVYTCFGGTHSSPVAAAIHLGKLPRDRLPTPQELLATPRFDTVHPKHRGQLAFAGLDKDGHRVYVLGRGGLSADAVRSLLETACLLIGGRPARVLVCDTLPCVNFCMRIGGWLSREAGLVGIGRPIVTWGTLRAYPRIVRLVREVEEQVRRLTRPGRG